LQAGELHVKAARLASCGGRVVEDYAVIYFGSAVFKISRLLLIAMMCAAPSSTSAAALLPSDI
jgi:hypothetical protein